MAEPQSASNLPKITSYEDFDVFSGGEGISRDEYKKASFHTSDMEEGDARFRSKAELLETSGPEILGNEEKLEFDDEKEREMETIKETKEAAL